MKTPFYILLLCLSFEAYGQKDSTGLLPRRNLQTYTPSALLYSGQWEYKIFNNLYTQTTGFDADGVVENYGLRSTFFTSIHQFLYGFTPRVNVGVDLWFKSVRVDAETSSPVSVFDFKNDVSNRTALGYFGPKIKFLPFERLANVSFQSTFLVPLSPDLEAVGRFRNSRPYLSENAFISINELFLDEALTEQFRIFLRVSGWFYFDRMALQNNTAIFRKYDTPVSGFLTYFASPSLSFYVQGEYWGKFSRVGYLGYFIQTGLGLKAQVVPNFLELEASYTRFVLGQNSGRGNTFNVGLRLIR